MTQITPARLGTFIRGEHCAVEESEEDEVRAMVEVNFPGLARTIHLVLPGMRQRRWGSVVSFDPVIGCRLLEA